jgi:transglutaminase-like putative cysteine protease
MAHEHTVRVIVERETAAALTAPYGLPARDSGGTVAAVLRREPLIQSSDPRIVAQAHEIVGGERDPGRVARLIGDWVYEHIDRRGSATLPSAVRVLVERRGDCNEHTLLYVALARAVGLPARTVAGLLYLDGRFYYHAWPEVYLADWVAVDPTLGQFPADAARLRLSTDALARQAELLPLIGGLKLEVL